MQYTFLLLHILFLTFLLPDKDNVSGVFIAGSEGHKTYRIPAIISLPNGSLLAFSEGRVNGSDDFGNINIVLKRSQDKGKTWGAMSTVVDYDTLQAGNPAPVVDLTDPRFPGGRIFLFYNTGTNSEGEVRKGNGYREVWYKTSADGGTSWSDGVNITAQVHRPYLPGINPSYKYPEDWRSYANTPGHAMQFMSGVYKGRIVIAANHSQGNPKDNWEDYFSHVYFTDDHGKTFSLGQSVSLAGSNESTAAEISGNRLIINARNQKGDIKARITAISSNGGKNWDKAGFDTSLPDPVCEGSILNIGLISGKYILAFSNPASTNRRDNLTLRISYDDGETWKVTIPVECSDELNNQRDYTAYSDIVKISNDELGILYERKDYNEIVFKLVKWR